MQRIYNETDQEHFTSTMSDINDKYSDYEVDVVFLGDSLTDGYNLKLYCHRP